MDSTYYKNRAKKRIIIIIVIVVLAGAGYWYISRLGLPTQIASLEDSAVKNVAQQIVGGVSNPPPLIATGTASGTTGGKQYTLTRAGVIEQTNRERQQNGNLPTLAENTELDTIATDRLDDMFKNQYFAHISPSSSSAITVAQTVGYSYIALGENLALGNFNGDVGVVTAWMGSPGHRANILDTHYTQIGVGVGEGIFDGQETWIAVQIFGRPASDCPSPDATVKTTIQNLENEITAMLSNLKTENSNLETMQQGSSAYDQAATSYNARVGQYNSLVAQEKQDISEYDDQVATYNACITK